MEKEPAVIVSTVTAFLMAIIGLGTAFGLDISQEQQDAVVKVVVAASAVIFLVGPAIRQFVTPTEKAEDAIDVAYDAKPGEPKPTL